MRLSEREEYDAALSGKLQKKAEPAEAAAPQEQLRPQERPPLLNRNWMILNCLFYLVFYIGPLMIVPTFIVGTKYDYFLYT